MIELCDIHYAYRDETGQPRPVLNGISMRIEPGESLAIMGANGSGKSTLVKCCNGLLLPGRGQVRVEGLDTADARQLPAIRRLIGMIFQNPDNQIVSTTVEREIAFGLENLGVPVDEMHARVDAMLRQFDLEPYRLKSPHYLSGGEKQRLALAAVLAMQPRYLILDEPTSLLDPQHRRQIIDLLGLLRQQQEVACVLVTQFADEALAAQRLAVLAGGRLFLEGEPPEIFSRVEELLAVGLEPPLPFFLDHLLQS
ncbi:MAG TPA: ATP-binding cassette domain-containing protein [bacterium]|nr:ATP-binding cassette domain-containing protein [bacterium]HPR87349.1 ATP-binding cassette domain-containing protein [bacterium]